MGWMHRKQEVGTNAPFYTLGGGGRDCVLIAGLGNPGKKYDGTRHNIGFACLDEFAANSEFPAWTSKKNFKSLESTRSMGDTKVILLKPQTYMNLSGEAVLAAVQFYKLTPEKIVVIHDELDIKFGQIRMRTGGSSAGHNGIESISQAFGENYGRIRIGVGPKQPKQVDSADFVLQKFSKEQQPSLKPLTQEVTSILTEFVYSGNLSEETRSFIA